MLARQPIVVSFMTANFVAREVGWSMRDWSQGEQAVQDAFRPIETYRERFAALCDEVVELGFAAIDLWDAHLNAAWATDEHVDVVRAVLHERGLRVASLAGWLGSDVRRVARTCEIAAAVGAPLLGGNTTLLADDPTALVDILERHDLSIGIENHPERRPDEVLARIGDGAGGRIGTTVDTGWWGTQGQDAAEAIRALAPHVLHVHLKNVLHAGMPHETCGYDGGVVPLRACVDALRDIGYAGAISVEHVPERHDPRPEIAEARERLEDWLAA